MASQPTHPKVTSPRHKANPMGFHKLELLSFRIVSTSGCVYLGYFQTLSDLDFGYILAVMIL